MQEVRETRVLSLGQEDPLEEGTATHSSILGLRILWTEEPGGRQSLGLQRVRHDWSDLARVHALLLLLFNGSVVSKSAILGIAAHQASLSFTISPSLLKLMCTESVMLSTISSSVVAFSFCLQAFPASGSFPMSHSSHQAAKVLELQFQHESFQWIFGTDFLSDLLVWSPCSPRDSQESSPAPQFEGISSLALSLFCCPALTSIHDYWKNHSFD